MRLPILMTLTPSPVTGNSSAATSPPPATRVPTRIREYSLCSFTPFPPLVEWPGLRASVGRARARPAPSAAACRRTEPSNESSGPRSRVSHEAQHIRSLHVPRVISLEYVVAQHALRILPQLRICRIPEPARCRGCLLRHVRDSPPISSTQPLHSRCGQAREELRRGAPKHPGMLTPVCPAARIYSLLRLPVGQEPPVVRVALRQAVPSLAPRPGAFSQSAPA